MSAKNLQTAENYPHVKAIIAAIANRRNGDRAASSADSYFYLLRAAHRVNVFEPFTEEQALLNDLLFELQAGKKSCEYAWELFVGKAGL